MGGVIMSQSRESDLVSSLYIITSVSDFDCLYDIEVLRVEENHSSYDESLHKKFKQQLQRYEGDWYQTGLVWTENKLPLNNKKFERLGRLKSPLKRLEQNPETFKDMIR